MQQKSFVHLRDDLRRLVPEIAKIEGGKKWILLEILEKLVTLWHPFAPFVTEVLYQQIHPLSEIKGEKKHSPKLLMVHEWPTAENKGVVKTAERDFHTIRSLVQAIRNARAENAIAASQRSKPCSSLVTRHSSSPRTPTYSSPSVALILSRLWRAGSGRPTPSF